MGEGGRGAGALPHALHVKLRHLASIGSPMQPAQRCSATPLQRSRDVSPLPFEFGECHLGGKNSPAVLKKA